jgi:ATP-dependent helicase/nuclease subunit B
MQPALHAPLYLPPNAGFWDAVADAILQDGRATGRVDYAGIRVVVPTVNHAIALQATLAARMPGPWIPPRICTMPAWLAMQAPEARAVADSERLMTLYAELRQHAWLKKLFSARSNTDLLPLAQTLLTLCDELTQAMLPAMQSVDGSAELRWDAALAQLTPAARALLSNEAQLVWSVWQTQLDGRDGHAARFAAMMALADAADCELVWVAPIESDPFDQAFLARYAQRQPVRTVLLGWHADKVSQTWHAAWPEVLAEPGPGGLDLSPRLSLCQAASLEDEAVKAAQTIVAWLAAGKTRLAIIAQDRVVARRIRALLERADVFVADETGWKLSTTRAAAALAAWFDVVTARADTVALLDLLKSPFVLAETPDKAACVMTIELALRRANVSGGWRAADYALERAPGEQAMVARLEQQALRFRGRKSLADWLQDTDAVLDSLQMFTALRDDLAGAQLLDMLAQLKADCQALHQTYSFAEWRAFLNMQMESQPFIGEDTDKRVVMLPLNGARLRSFDAVLMVGADAAHLPSQPAETLFFANAVRSELGLATRESRQLQQLRDFVELLQCNAEVLLFWQGHKDNEPNPVSPWIARLELSLAQSGAALLPSHTTELSLQRLQYQPSTMPTPSAAALLPKKLSASGYNSLVACPYQFFATRMLGLSTIDELSDLPEKRDYGDWLHRVLNKYHQALQEQNTAEPERLALLEAISEQVFAPELEKNAGALGFYIRWKKALPAYLDWANTRQEEGWSFAFGEYAREVSLALPDGGDITLHGRIDRVDENAAGERAVLDYKTKDVDALKGRLKEGEDQQLAFYGLLSDAPVEHAHYVALELKNKKTGDVEAADYAMWQDALRHRIGSTMVAIKQGAPLAANGIEVSCQYCDVRGLCRKGAW